MTLSTAGKFTVLHFCIFTIFSVFSACLLTQLGAAQFKFVAGFVVGTYILAGKEVIKIFIWSLRHRRVPHIDKHPLVRWLMLSALFILAFAAVIGWYASWEGITGWLFGIGVFLAALIGDYGVSTLISKEDPFSLSGDPPTQTIG